MTLEKLIRFLRSSVSVQAIKVDENGNEISADVDRDPAYLAMTDEDLTLYIEIALDANFPDLSIEDDIPSENVYAVTLLSKRELYQSLAVKDAPLFDLGADSAYLKRSDRFNHYMELVKVLDDEYQAYLDNGGAGSNTVSVHDVTLSNRWGTKYNYEKGSIPALSLYVRGIAEKSVEIEWKASPRRFANYKVYIDTKPIVDTYVDPPISKELKEVALIDDIHRNKCRIEGLEPNTDYFIAVSVSEKNGLTGYATKAFTTLSEQVFVPPVIPEETDPENEVGGETSGN